MELLHERCAALDIGKKELKACVRAPSPKGKRSRRQEIRTYATTTNSLLELRDWLVAEQVTLVVLEATGDYWRGAAVECRGTDPISVDAGSACWMPPANPP